MVIHVAQPFALEDLAQGFVDHTLAEIKHGLDCHLCIMQCNHCDELDHRDWPPLVDSQMIKTLPSSASLRTRTILLVLGLLFFSLLALAFTGAQMLRRDMQEILSNQQYSTATVIASQIELELSERVSALNRVSKTITTAMLADSAAVQSHLETQPTLQDPFNGGAFVTDADGVIIAAHPYTGQRGISLIDRDYINVALNEGIPSIGRPVLSKKLEFPVLAMAVPIRDGNGTVVGVLAGATNLSRPNFLDRVMGHAYGKTGGYALVAAKSRLVVTSSDKREIIQALPRPGLDPVIDRLMNGYDGSLVMNDSHGTEVLASAKTVPMAGWYLLATLPTSEAFGPFLKLQYNMMLVTVALMIIAGFITAWLLSGFLAPMLTTVTQLASMSAGRMPLQSLPLKGPTEIDLLVAGFNQLIGTLKDRENELIRNRAFYQGVLNSVPEEIAVLDRNGAIVDVNKPWRRCGHTAERCGACRPAGVGRNYLSPAESGDTGLTNGPPGSTDGIKAVLNGQLPKFSIEYPCQLEGSVAWYSMSVTPLESSAGGVVVSHTDITQRRLAQEAMREAKQFQESVIQGVQEGIVVYGLDLHYQLWNSYMEQFTGLTASQVLGRNPAHIFPFLTDAGVMQTLQLAIAGQGGNVLEFPFTMPHNQKSGWIKHTSAPLRNANGAVIGVIASIIDISSSKQGQLALEATLLEKDALFKEVHHRVKNNLQVINSLLRLEGGRSTQADTRAVLKEMMGRIRSMAILHELLYRSASLAAIDLGNYLRELATQACRSMENSADHIDLKLELATVAVAMDRALTCGLMVNELLSNTFKHGFPNGGSGSIHMELMSLDDGSKVRLRISDTGVGLPSNFQIGQSDSLGLHLVSDLAEQLDGHLEYATGPNACFTVTFPIGDILLG